MPVSVTIAIVLLGEEYSGPVDDDAAHGSSVAANPLGCRMNHYVSAVFNQSEEVSTSTERIIGLVITNELLPPPRSARRISNFRLTIKEIP